MIHFVLCAVFALQASGVFLEVTTSAGDTIKIEPFGLNSLRVRVRLGPGLINDTLPGALLAPSGAEIGSGNFALGESQSLVDGSNVTNGNIGAHVGVDGLVTVTRVSDGKVILQELSRLASVLDPASKSLHTASVTFASTSTESIYGFGEHQQGHLNMKGAKYDMEQCLDYGHSHGGEVCLPFILGGTAPSSVCSVSPPLGCYHDGSTRILPFTTQPINDPQLTVEKCAKKCGELGYPVMGVESGTQCYCGHDLPEASHKVDNSTCKQSCAGNKKENCGAAWTMAVHRVNCSSTGTQGSLQYGFLWNMPNYGSVSFGESSTNWTAYDATQLDYFVSTFGKDAAGTSRAGAQIMNSYVDATGHSPMLPGYAAGYWHSKNRYASQADLLAAAEGFHNRSIPVDIIVIDYHHWVAMGDWSFDSTKWPDIPLMMKTLEGYGMKVMVSVWPFSATGSKSITDVSSKALAVKTGENHTAPVWWNDNNCNAQCYLLDQSQADTRAYFWERLNAGYYQHGIKIYWLDASEPEISTGDARKAAMDSYYSVGSSQAAGMMYPYWHTRAVHDGLVSAGEKDGNIIQLTRSAWAGMQRWGAALWSGDTRSRFSSLKVSIQAGLNTQLSGIAWWTTDIGGYSGGNPADPTFRELIVRWFQYGATCPLFRQHGARATEIWGYGKESETAIVKMINWRKQQKDYLMAQMNTVATSGLPVNRPLWFDFPHDQKTWAIKDSYMFGPDYLVSPVTEMGARTWTLYLPDAGASRWEHVFSQKQYEGGQTVTIATPLDEFPLFKRSPLYTPAFI